MVPKQIWPCKGDAGLDPRINDDVVVAGAVPPVQRAVRPAAGAGEARYSLGSRTRVGLRQPERGPAPRPDVHRDAPADVRDPRFVAGSRPRPPRAVVGRDPRDPLRAPDRKGADGASSRVPEARHSTRFGG